MTSIQQIKDIPGLEDLLSDEIKDEVIEYLRLRDLKKKQNKNFNGGDLVDSEQEDIGQ